MDKVGLKVDTSQTNNLCQVRPHKRFTAGNVEKIDRTERFENALNFFQGEILLGDIRICMIYLADIAGLTATLTGGSYGEGQRQWIDWLDPAPSGGRIIRHPRHNIDEVISKLHVVKQLNSMRTINLPF